MATLFAADGFDSTEYRNSNAFGAITNDTLVTGYGGRGSALSFTAASWTTGWDAATYRLYSFKFKPTQVSGWAIRCQNFSGETHWGVRFEAAQWELHRDAGAIIATYPRNGNAWVTIEVQVSVGGASSVRWRMDGNNVVTSGTYDTLRNSTQDLNLFDDGYYDDWYSLNNPATDMTDMLGIRAVSRIIPDGDGTYTGWTGSYLDVDDDPVDTLTEVTAGSASLKETFTMSALPVTALSVDAVVVEATIDGTRNILPLFATSGAGSEANGTAFAAPGAITRADQLHLTNPVTAVAWTPSDVDTYEFGVESS